MSWSQVRILPEAKAKVAQLVEHVKSILFNSRACSSVVERSAHNGLVAGSFPAGPTNFMLSSKRGRLPVVVKEGLQERADTFRV